VDFALTLVRPARPTRSAANIGNISRVSQAAPSVIVDVVVSSSAAAALEKLPSSETQVELQCADVPRGLQCAIEPSSVDLARETNAVRVTSPRSCATAFANAVADEDCQRFLQSAIEGDFGKRRSHYQLTCSCFGEITKTSQLEDEMFYNLSCTQSCKITYS